MYIVPLLFGLGCGLAIWLAAPEAKRYALSLLTVWAGANALWSYDMLDLLPVLDLAFGAYVIQSHHGVRPRWLTVLIQLIAARLVLHVLDYATGSVFLVAYIHGLNLLFMLQLAVVSFSGRSHGRFRLLRGLRRIPVLLRFSRAA